MVVVMLAAIRASDQKKVYSFHSRKQEGPWLCPDPACGEQLLLRICDDKIDHFAHYPGLTCGNSSGETYLHYAAKKDLFEKLSKDSRVTGLELERVLKGCRPDISFYYEGKPIVIEVQLANLTMGEIDRRTRNYFKLGVAVLWVNLTGRGEEDVFLPKDWERYISSLGFGSYFQWRVGLEEGVLLEEITHEKVLRRWKVDGCYEYEGFEGLVPVYRSSWRGAWEVPECYVVVAQSFLKPKKPARLRTVTSSRGLDPIAFGDPGITWTKDELRVIKRDLLNPNAKPSKIDLSDVVGPVRPVQELDLTGLVLDDTEPPPRIEQIDFGDLLGDE
jgi:hypothetical protein